MTLAPSRNPRLQSATTLDPIFEVSRSRRNGCAWSSYASAALKVFHLALSGVFRFFGCLQVQSTINSLVGWAKRSVPTYNGHLMVGTLRFAHPTRYRAPAITRATAAVSFFAYCTCRNSFGPWALDAFYSPYRADSIARSMTKIALTLLNINLASIGRSS
jgi:hypothetical protein